MPRSAVFFVLAVHGVGLLALLLQGCHREDSTAQADKTTNAAPTFEATNLPAIAEPTIPGATNTTPWIVTAGVIDSNSTSQPPHAGTWKAWLNGYGSVHTDTLLQSATISSTATAVTLSFWLHIDTAETSTTAYDTLKIQIRNSSGTVLSTLASYSNLSAKAGYAQVSFDLTAYKGQTIQVYLIGVEDSSLKTSFVVDDFMLNVTTP